MTAPRIVPPRTSLFVIAVSLATTGLAQNPPQLFLAKQTNYVQTSASSLAPSGGRFFVFFGNPNGPAPWSWMARLETNGKTYPLNLTPTRPTYTHGIAFEKAHDTTSAMESEFPTGSSAKIVVESHLGKGEASTRLPGRLTAPSPVILNFDALQSLTTTSFRIEWRLPTCYLIGSGGPYIQTTILPIEIGVDWVLSIYRADDIGLTSNATLLRSMRVSGNGANIDLPIAAGEIVYAELAPEPSAIKVDPGWIRFPIRRLAIEHPTITAQPADQSARIGGKATFTVSAAGTTPTYRWQKNGASIAGATQATLEIDGVQASDEGLYRVIVSNVSGEVTSRSARLTVYAPPTLTTQPLGQTVFLGSDVTFTAAAHGTEPLTYQWFRDGQMLAGASQGTLALKAVSFSDAGSYSVSISNPGGTITSAAAALVVQAVSRISNVSIRAQVGGISDPLAVGITIGGARTTGDKPLLVRAIGPGLAAFGMGGTLSDPRLSILSGSTSVATNDDWSGDTAVTTLSSAVGAFGLPEAASKDAAIAQAFTAGSYTAQVTGPGVITGVALAEVYDASPGETFTISTPRLTNVSALTHVGTGSDVLIAGFSIAGTAPKQVLIRGIGPALAAFGASGTLADPKLELFRAGSATAMATNDNWATAANADDVAAAAVNVGAFALARTSRDAALLISLPPGTYSAQVSGVNNTTGTALVEVYELP